MIGARNVPTHLPLRDRRSGSTVDEGTPIKSLKESMLLDVFHPVVEIPNALALIRIQQFFNEILPNGLRARSLTKHLCPGVDRFWVGDSAVQNLLIDHKGIVVAEWWIPLNEFIEEHTQAPKIDGRSMASALNDFRRQVLRRPAQRPRPGVASTGGRIFV